MNNIDTCKYTYKYCKKCKKSHPKEFSKYCKVCRRCHPISSVHCPKCKICVDMEEYMGYHYFYCVKEIQTLHIDKHIDLQKSQFHNDEICDCSECEEERVNDYRQD